MVRAVPMKKFCANLKGYATELTNHEKRKCYKQANKDKLCHMWKKEFDEEFNEDQNYCQI